MRIADLPLATLVFVAQECSACAEYKPRLERIAGRWAQCVPTYVLDVRRYERLANAMHVQYTPTTIVVRHGRELGRLDGSAEDHKVDGLYASVARSCPVQPLPAPAGELEEH